MPNICPILTNISLKQEEEEQLRITGTETPVEKKRNKKRGQLPSDMNKKQ